MRRNFDRPQISGSHPARQMEVTMQQMQGANTADEIDLAWHNMPHVLGFVPRPQLARFADVTMQAMSRAGLEFFSPDEPVDERVQLLLDGADKISDAQGELQPSCPPGTSEIHDSLGAQSRHYVPPIRRTPSVNRTGSIMVSGGNQILGGRVFGQTYLQLRKQTQVEKISGSDKKATDILDIVQRYTQDEIFKSDETVSDHGVHSYMAVREVSSDERGFAPDLWGIRAIYNQSGKRRSAMVAVPTGRLFAEGAKEIMRQQDACPDYNLPSSPASVALRPLGWLPEYTTLQIVAGGLMPAGVQYETYDGIVSRTLASIKAQTE